LLFENIASGNAVTYPEKMMNALRSVLRSGNTRLVDNMLDELFRYVQVMNLSLFAFRSFYNEIINVIMKEYTPTEDVNSVELYDIFSISKCLSLDDLNETLRGVCHNLLKGMSEADEGFLPVIRSVELYMQENYDNPNLNISFLAAHFGISARSLSEDFKKKNGISPSEYLIQIRLDKAKKLLAETETSVREIGIIVGYDDVSGFIRRFRTYSGMTPNSYRAQQK